MYKRCPKCQRYITRRDVSTVGTWGKYSIPIIGVHGYYCRACDYTELLFVDELLVREIARGFSALPAKKRPDELDIADTRNILLEYTTLICDLIATEKLIPIRAGKTWIIQENDFKNIVPVNVLLCGERNVRSMIEVDVIKYYSAGKRVYKDPKRLLIAEFDDRNDAELWASALNENLPNHPVNEIWQVYHCYSCGNVFFIKDSRWELRDNGKLPHCPYCASEESLWIGVRNQPPPKQLYYFYEDTDVGCPNFASYADAYYCPCCWGVAFKEIKFNESDESK